MCFVLTQQHWLLPNVWLDPPKLCAAVNQNHFLQTPYTRLLCTSTFYCSIHTTQPNLSLRHWKQNFQNVCILHYICHLSFNPDCCAKLLKRCILNTEKYRNTDAFVLLEWMGEGETPISRMCVQPNIRHSILIFVPNIWGP